MLKHSYLIAATLTIAAACTTDETSLVTVDVYIDDLHASTLAYEGPSEFTDEVRDSIADQLQGAASAFDSPVSFVVDDGVAPVGGFVTLPEGGALHLDITISSVADEWGFVSVPAPERSLDEDGVGSSAEPLMMLCHSDPCKELRCQLGVVPMRYCDKPLCTNAYERYWNSSPQSCGIPGYHPCTMQICLPVFGCTCVWG